MKKVNNFKAKWSSIDKTLHYLSSSLSLLNCATYQRKKALKLFAVANMQEKKGMKKVIRAIGNIYKAIDDMKDNENGEKK